MKKRGKLLIAFILVSFSLFSLAFPAFASVDGNVKRVLTNSLSLRTGAGTGYGLIMTMANGEASAEYAYQGAPNDGNYWVKLKGWKSSTSSIVTGWAADYVISSGQGYMCYVQHATVKNNVDLNIYNTDAVPQSWDGQAVIPAGATMLCTDGGEGDQVVAYSDLEYIGVDYYEYNGHSVFLGQIKYVHPKFKTSSPSGYYVTLE